MFRVLMNNVKILLIGVVTIMVSGGACWYYWQNYYNKVMLVSSVSWQVVNASLNNDIEQPEIDAAQHFSNTNNNNYGALISLGLARYYVHKDNFPAAEKQLKKALSQTSERHLKSLICLRLARVQLQQNYVNDALHTLNVIKLKGWTALAEDIRGDILQVKGEYEAAREAYEKALKINPPPTLAVLVRMKLNNLSS